MFGMWLGLATLAAAAAASWFYRKHAVEKKDATFQLGLFVFNFLLAVTTALLITAEIVSQAA